MHDYVKNTLEGLLGQSRPNWYGVPGIYYSSYSRQSYSWVAARA